MKRVTKLILSSVAVAVVLASICVPMMTTVCSDSGGFSALVSKVASGDSGWPSEEGAHEAKAANLDDFKLDQQVITCWGDSLTEGIGADYAFVEVDGEPFDASFQSYPEILERLTGIPTVNFGVSGATSEDIVFLQKALLRLRAVDAADASSTRDSHQNGDVLVLELGSNGGWDEDYETLIGQYREMIDCSGCDNYIIIGDTDDPGTSIADVWQEPLLAGEGAGETAWEAELSEAFGDHFINMRSFLVERGLEVAGLEATEEDDEAASRGCVSEQLRSDWTHLNSYGYYAQAVAVYEKGQELGYW